MAGNSKSRGAADYRRALAARVRDRSDELAEAIFDRVWKLEDGPNLEPPRSFGGLRPLIRSLVEYGAVAIELGERRCPPPPPVVLEHAQNAAWAAPSRDLNQGYGAGRTVFNHFLRREAPSVEGYRESTFFPIQESNDIVYERLARIVSERFERETEEKRRSPAIRRLERVKALLAGEVLEAPDLGYEFDAAHIGIVGKGENLSSLIKDIAKSLGGRSLVVEPVPQKVWAWIGTRYVVPSDRIEGSVEELPATICLAVGRPAPGLAGWQRTHEQAEAAFRIAARTPGSAVCYAGVDLIAAAARDALIRTDLQRTYLEPLSQERDGGQALRQTLRVYFEAELNASTASKLLGVSRQTVTNHVQRVEHLLGFPVRSGRSPALQVALQLEELGFFDPA